jgi:hypothetical protein
LHPDYEELVAEMKKSLKGVNFPLNKQNLIQKAEENDLSSLTLDAIKNLPEDDFNSPKDVVEILDEKMRLK